MIEVKRVQNKNLLELLLDQKHFVDNPCNGKGLCGKCKVKIISGEVNSLTSTEERLLTSEEIESGIRLSCLVVPQEDLKVELLKKELNHKVLTSGYMPKFEINTSIKKKVIDITRSSLDEQTPLEDQILLKSGAKSIDYEILKDLIFDEGIYTVVTNNYKNNLEIIGLEKGDTTSKLYGISMDIGTTTVVVALIDLNTGDEISNDSMINAQKHFGLDVLTRITYELEHPEDGIRKLQEAMVNSINTMIESVCEKSKVSKENIYEVAIGANCTMMHMLLGVDATSIGKAPYAPVFVKAKNINARDIGIEVAQFGRIYCLPSVSSYIGADIVAGVYVCQLEKSKENILFIDIGTNGEIVLSKGGELLCCSCAAGPALEGMNISSGMRASDGAIEDVVITKSGIETKVIGDNPPIGVCGSGILAVVRELVLNGLIKKDGAFIKKEKLEESDYRYKMIQMKEKKREFILTEEPEKILITQGDVRQVQLAKGAILSGFYALLKKADITMEDLDKVMIAGQFGAHLPADSLIGTGILPKEVKEKLVYVGNSSKTGAYMALMSNEAKSEMERLAHKMKYLELGATEGYERLFAQCLIFPKVEK